jgi:hypothetical protein
MGMRLIRFRILLGMSRGGAGIEVLCSCLCSTERMAGETPPSVERKDSAQALVHYVCLAIHHIASEAAQIMNV